MRIVINESAILSEMVSELLSQDDPDYPLDQTSGLSTSLNRRVKNILSAAMTEQRFFKDPLVDYYVNEIRNDYHLSHLLMLPWQDFKILDRSGTIAMFMRLA